MKQIITVLLIMSSLFTFSQRKVTIVFDSGMSTVDGFVEDGFQITLKDGCLVEQSDLPIHHE